MRFLLLVVSLCACAPAQLTSKHDPHSEDPAIYRAVLDSLPLGQAGRRPTRFVVVDSTFTIRSEDLDLEKSPGVDSAAISDFQRRNRESRSLTYLSSLDLSVPIVLINRDALKSFLVNGPEAYWNEFYRKYPGSEGSFAFSSIGYSADGNTAVLAVERGCGSLCGALSSVVVKRERGRWRVALIRILIMS